MQCYLSDVTFALYTAIESNVVNYNKIRMYFDFEHV